LKLPQLPEGVHDHVTPPLALSFDTIAVNVCVPFVWSDAVDGFTLTEIGWAWVEIVTVAVAVFVVSLTEAAVIVTGPLGTVLGAM
jgi:hypothetical protein